MKSVLSLSRYGSLGEDFRLWGSTGDTKQIGHIPGRMVLQDRKEQPHPQWQQQHYNAGAMFFACTGKLGNTHTHTYTLRILKICIWACLKRCWSTLPGSIPGITVHVFSIIACIRDSQYPSPSHRDLHSPLFDKKELNVSWIVRSTQIRMFWIRPTHNIHSYVFMKRELDISSIWFCVTWKVESNRFPTNAT